MKKEKKKTTLIQVKGFIIDPQLAQTIGKDKTIKRIRKDINIAGDQRKRESIIASSDKDFDRLKKVLHKYLDF